MGDINISPDNVRLSNLDYQAAFDIQHILHARLVSLTTGVSFTIMESSSGEGIEAWRVLSQKKQSSHSLLLRTARSWDH